MRSAATLRSRTRLCLASLALTAFLPAAQARPDVLSKLRSGGELTCQPSLPVFCANMHVACAGRTSIPTFPFTLRLSHAGAAVRSTAPASPLYERPSVHWDAQGSTLLLQPADGPGYVRVLADGTFALRHYAQSGGVMSLGVCR